jgi:CRP/FNR family cyclic AMP-dependent transcriptional regulator
MSIDTYARAMQEVPMFANVAPKRLKLLALASSCVLYGAGEELCTQGEEGDAAYILLDGEADVTIDSDKGTTTVAKLKSNDVFGELAILRDMPRNATVTAATDVRALRIGKQDFLNLLKEFPDVSIEISRTLAERLARTTAELAETRAAADGA